MNSNDETRVGEISDAVFARAALLRKSAATEKDPRTRVLAILEADKREQETAVAFGIATIAVAVTMAETALTKAGIPICAEHLRLSLKIMMDIVPYDKKETAQYMAAMIEDIKDVRRDEKRNPSS